MILQKFYHTRGRTFNGMQQVFNTDKSTMVMVYGYSFENTFFTGLQDLWGDLLHSAAAFASAENLRVIVWI